MRRVDVTADGPAQCGIDAIKGFRRDAPIHGGSDELHGWLNDACRLVDVQMRRIPPQIVHVTAQQRRKRRAGAQNLHVVRIGLGKQRRQHGARHEQVQGRTVGHRDGLRLRLVQNKNVAAARLVAVVTPGPCALFLELDGVAIDQVAADAEA